MGYRLLYMDAVKREMQREGEDMTEKQTTLESEIKYEDQEERWQLELTDTVKLELLGTVFCRSGWVGMHHSHNFWELVYIKKENDDPFEMICLGQNFTCERNTLFLIPPNVPHLFRNYGREPAKNLYIGFSYTFSPAKKLRTDMPVIIGTDHAEVIGILSLLNEFSELAPEEIMDVLDQKRLDVMREVVSVFHMVLSDDERYAASNSHRNILLCNKVKDYIMQNLNRRISVDELARQFYISSNYLGQIFRQVTGMTVKNYHNRMRMEYALRLITENQHSIGKVASMVGFDDIAYFSRKFKEFYGVAPSQIVIRGQEEPSGASGTGGE